MTTFLLLKKANFCGWLIFTLFHQSNLKLFWNFNSVIRFMQIYPQAKMSAKVNAQNLMPTHFKLFYTNMQKNSTVYVLLLAVD